MKHVLIVSLFLFASHTKTFAEELHGIFMVVKGDVEVESKKTGKFKAKVSAKVYAGDTINCGPDGRAKIVMSDRNVLNVSPDTKIAINKYENDSQSGVKNVDIELSKGKLRSNVEQKYDGEKSQFLIKTPTAVAGVRGTQFLTSFDPVSMKTQIVTFKGSVAFALKGSDQQVFVKKGESSSASQGQAAPEPPKPVKKDELEQMNKSSNSAKTEKDDAGKKDVAATGPDGKKDDSKKDDGGKDQKRGPASEGSSESMIDKKDMDTGAIAKEVAPPINATAPPPQLPPIPRPIGPPGPGQQNSVIDEIVRSKINKTKVIIVPTLPGK